MNQAIINLLLTLFMLFASSVFIISLWVRHRIFVDKAIIQDGVLKSTGGRYRLTKTGKLYGIFDFMHKRPIIVENVHDYFVVSEGMPFFGITKTLNVTVHIDLADNKDEIKVIEEMAKINPKKAKKAYKKLKTTVQNIVPWIIPDKLDLLGELNEYTYSWALDRRIEAWEETKHLTKQEMMLRFYIPMGLMILAALLIIFYPRILESVRDPALDLVNNRLTTWTEILRGFR